MEFDVRMFTSKVGQECKNLIYVRRSCDTRYELMCRSRVVNLVFTLYNVVLLLPKRSIANEMAEKC